MTQDIKSAIYNHKRTKIIYAIEEALDDQWECNMKIQDGIKEVWINKNLDIKTEKDSLDDEWVCIFSPRMFSFVSYDSKDEIEKYKVEEYLIDILNDLGKVDVSDQLLYEYSLENYYEEE